MNDLVSIPWTFWSAAATLACLALAFVLPPLLRGARRAPTGEAEARAVAVYRLELSELAGDQRAGLLAEAESEAARAELEVRLASELEGRGDAASGGASGGGRWRVAVPLAVLMPALAVTLYLALGTPAALHAEGGASPDAPVAAGPAGAGEGPAQAIGARTDELEARVKAVPEDGEAWLLLAGAYATLERYSEAVPAYARATELRPQDARAWSGYAEALAVTQGHSLDGRPLELIYKALELDGNDPKGLELLGISNYQRGNYTQAAYYWRRLLRQLPEESPYAMDIRGAIADATGRARAATDEGGPPPPEAPVAPGGVPAAE